MNKLNILLTEANGNLSNIKGAIEAGAKIAEEYAFSTLNIDWDIDILITNRLYDIVIPEDGVGGRTITNDFIEFAINESTATKSSISEMIVHELCHAARWGKNDEWANSLFDNLINEGIATYFESVFAGNREEKTVFISTILSRSDKENEKILNELHGQLDSPVYDYASIFFNGNDHLPRWAGYSLGYYLVKKYLKKNKKNIQEAFTDKYIDFRSVL